MLKRMAVLIAIGAALCVPAQAMGSLCLIAPECAALIDDSGEALLEDIEDGFAVREGALYAAGRKGAYRLYDAGGRLLSETMFSMIDDQDDCLIFGQDGRFGAMDEAGNVLLEPDWTQLTCDGRGGWLALDADPMDERPDEIVHIESDGETMRTGVYTASGLARIVSERMPYMSANGLYGATNARGEVVIAPQWRYIGSFEAGLAKATGSEGIGLIDWDGGVVLSPIYSWLERGQAMIAARSEEGVKAFDANGTRLFDVPGEGLEAALAGDYLVVWNGDGAQVYNAGGTPMAAASARATFAPGAGGQLIAWAGDWGEACQWLVNPDGSAASERFQRLVPLCEGRYAFMELDGIEYYSDALDRLQTSWDYDSVRWGLMDDGGTILLPAVYREIRALGEDRLLLRDGEGAALATKDGAVIRRWPGAEGEAPSAGAGA